MSFATTPAKTVSEAWLLGLEHAVSAKRGKTVHLMMTVLDPGREIPSIRAVLDQALERAGAQSVQTVAETIFPRSLYPDPGFDWEDELPSEKEELLDDAANAMYDMYVSMLPMLRTESGSASGTYFARMVTWPGKEAGGTNQLEARIARLRGEHRNRRRTQNTLDVDIAADSLVGLEGVQMYHVEDQRIRGFPCLVHLDFTLHDGLLHCTAVYRHHYLLQKAYGNLLGLSWLMEFLCQQTGFKVGELVVHATFADAEKRGWAREVVDACRGSLDEGLGRRL